MPRMSGSVGGVPRAPSSTSTQNLGWKEVHMRVRDWRRKFVHLFVKTPTDITFRRLGPNLLRCYFLLSPGQGRESSLYYADINLDQMSSHRIVYQELLDSSNTFLWRRTSKEEQLLSERRRISTWGIINYELHASSGTLVFPAASTIFQCVHPEKPSGPVSVKELSSSRVRLNPQICPTNHNLIAFSARYDIYIYNTATGIETKVTHSNKGNVRLEFDSRSSGVPSYVMQEEFSRFQGYWWQPVSYDGVYRLLYEEVEERKVPIVQFISPDETTGMVDEFRFPRAGSENAESELRMLEIELGHNDELLVTGRDLFRNLKTLAPWHEYMVRVGWTPDGLNVWCQLLSRDQQRLELILIPVECFCDSQLHYFNTILPKASYPPQSIIKIKSATWIDVHNMIHFVTSTVDPLQKMVIMASEDTGSRHLFVYFCTLSSMPKVAPYIGTSDHFPFSTTATTTRIQITTGNWCVLTNGIWVDEKNYLVYFMGLMDTPLEQHLYCVSIDRGKSKIQRLTEPGYSHQAFLNEDCTIFATVFSNTKVPGQSQIFRITIAPLSSEDLVTVTRVGDLVNEPLSDSLMEIKPLVEPEIFKTNLSSGEQIYSMIFKPHNFVQGKKYPTVLHIYGGPQVQLVTNTFKGFRHMRTHMLAAHGFCVVSIDSRGSDNRGVDFQSHIYTRMGTVEVEDQLEVLKDLARNYDFIDLNRLGIFGWSYGGYLSLMALAQRPEFFKLAIAGAPVVSWNLYDTGYTERYMGLPATNPTGYRNGSVISYINNFPDQENRLLIVQGMIDENVHFYHTNQLVQHLIKAGKPYQLQIYPRERHCLRQLDSNEHYETKLLSFLLQHL